MIPRYWWIIAVVVAIVSVFWIYPAIRDRFPLSSEELTLYKEAYEELDRCWDLIEFDGKPLTEITTRYDFAITGLTVLELSQFTCEMCKLEKLKKLIDTLSLSTQVYWCHDRTIAFKLKSYSVFALPFSIERHHFVAFSKDKPCPVEYTNAGLNIERNSEVEEGIRHIIIDQGWD